MQCVQKLFKIDAESPFCIACDRIADGTFDESSGCFDCAPERFSFQNTGSHHRGEEISRSRSNAADSGGTRSGMPFLPKNIRYRFFRRARFPYMTMVFRAVFPQLFADFRNFREKCLILCDACDVFVASSGQKTGFRQIGGNVICADNQPLHFFPEIRP